MSLPELTDAEKSQLLGHLNSKWKNKECPFCEQNKWQVGGFAPVSLSDAPGRLTIGGFLIPAIVILCQNCGYIVTVSAIVVGLDRRV